MNLEICFYISFFPADVQKYAQKLYAQVIKLVEIDGQKYHIELWENQKNVKKKREKLKFMA